MLRLELENEGYPKVPDDFTITEKAPIRASRRFQPGEGPSLCIGIPILHLLTVGSMSIKYSVSIVS